MKSRRNLFVLSTFAFLTLSLSQPSFAATTSFKDLANVPGSDKIIELQEEGILHGVNNDFFLPEATITTAEGIQLIVNALDLNLDAIRFVKPPQASDYYTKANNDAWYASALIIAANNGLDLPSDLEPNKMWTKEEFINQLILAMESHSNLPTIKIAPVEFGDIKELNPSYEGSVQRSIVLGIAKLDKDGKFHPKEEVSRKEAAELIYNAFAYMKAHPAPSVDPNKKE